MQQECSTQSMQEDTIDLRELFEILKRRKKLIGIVTAAVTILATVYAFVIAKPVYEAKVMLEVGKINGKTFENTGQIKQRLLFQYGKREGRRAYITPVRIPKGAVDMLEIVASGGERNAVVSFLKKVVQEIASEGERQIARYVVMQKRLIALAENDIALSKKSLEQYQKMMTSDMHGSRSSSDEAMNGLYIIQMSQHQIQMQTLQSHIFSLESKLVTLQQSIDPGMLKHTRMVGKVDAPEVPVKPKKLLMVIVAFITGLMLSVFLAFFLEFVSGLKEEEKNTEKES